MSELTTNMPTNGSAITPDTLRRQAAVARDAGFTQLGENLARAAELTRVPNERLLRMYELLRPGRSTQAELEAVADELATVFSAPLSAQLVREAIAAYAARSLFRKA
jgi:propanediol dehydratase small subunit